MPIFQSLLCPLTRNTFVSPLVSWKAWKLTSGRDASSCGIVNNGLLLGAVRCLRKLWLEIWGKGSSTVTREGVGVGVSQYYPCAGRKLKYWFSQGWLPGCLPVTDLPRRNQINIRRRAGALLAQRIHPSGPGLRFFQGLIIGRNLIRVGAHSAGGVDRNWFNFLRGTSPIYRYQSTNITTPCLQMTPLSQREVCDPFKSIMNSATSRLWTTHPRRKYRKLSI